MGGTHLTPESWLSSLKLALMAALSFWTTARSSAMVFAARTLRMNCFTSHISASRPDREAWRAGIHEVIVAVARTPPGQSVENHQLRRGGAGGEGCSGVGRAGGRSRKSVVTRCCNGGRLFGAPALHPKPAAAMHPGLTSDRRAFLLGPKRLGAHARGQVMYMHTESLASNPGPPHGFRSLSERSVIACLLT